MQTIAWVGQQELTQASFLAYMDAFWVLTRLALTAVPLTLSLRKIKLGGGAPRGPLMNIQNETIGCPASGRASNWPRGCFENAFSSIKLSPGEDFGDRLRVRARAVRGDSRERAAAHARAGGNPRRLTGR